MTGNLTPAAFTSEQERLLGRALNDPVLFAEVFLQCDLWPLQKRILRSVATNRRTIVKSCHASGKSFCAAAAALFWLAKYQDAIVILTAPVFSQVTKVLFGELKSHLSRSLYPFPPALTTELRLGPKRFCIGISTDDCERAAGYHAENSLWIFDEAGGVSEGMHQALEGARSAGNVSVLMLGQPLSASGRFYEPFANPKGWNCITISAKDTPNFEGITDFEQLRGMSEEELSYAPRPYLISRLFVLEKLDEWPGGDEHPLFASRIKR